MASLDKYYYRVLSLAICRYSINLGVETLFSFINLQSRVNHYNFKNVNKEGNPLFEIVIDFILSDFWDKSNKLFMVNNLKGMKFWV